MWRDVLRQDDPGDLAASVETALSIPFIDYARGDGLAVGPGGDVEWTPIVVDDTTGWIDGFRGLWGLDTKDRFAGERAPAGPKYTRERHGAAVVERPARVPRPGQVRAAASRAGGPARSHRDPGCRARRHARPGRRPGRRRPSRLRGACPVRNAETEAETGPTKGELALRVAESELAALRARDATLADELEAARAALALSRGRSTPAIRAPTCATTSGRSRRRCSSTAASWSSGPPVSAGVLLIVLVVTLYLEVVPIWAALLLTLGGYVAIEAAFRRRLVAARPAPDAQLFAIIGAIVLAVAYLPLLIVAAIAGVAILAIIDNVRELRA